jgi:hypothetical protein
MNIPFLQKDFRQVIQEHLEKDPSECQIITQQFEKYNHPNIHLALEELFNKGGYSRTIIGVQGGFMSFMGVPLTELVAPGSVASMMGLGGAKRAPVQYANIELGDGKKLACVQSGLYLVSGPRKFAVMLRQQMMDFSGQGGFFLDVLCQDKTIAEELMNAIQLLIQRNNVYRGKILSIAKNEAQKVGTGGTGIQFHSLPPVTRDKIILPDGLIQRIERQTVEAAKYSEALLKARRKLKRGMLLHGKPGTGKTLTAMYLASEMKERTVLIVTGQGLGLIEQSCQIAKWLAPSMVIIEDVDLVAQERSMQEKQGCSTPILFELLNQMDGLSDDLDVLFLLTTNRPDVLEPALASRPGRIDQAYEIPLPDLECRRRLFDLYAEGLIMKVSDIEGFLTKTDGASGAFIQELFRKAAIFAAPEGSPIAIEDKHLDDALHELVFVGGAMTKALLGFDSDKN